MKKYQKITLVVFTVLLLFAAGIFFLKSASYPPNKTAESLARQTPSEQDFYLFPADVPVKGSFIFYPGALVSPESYSIWASTVAQAGYDVYILRLPLDLAVLAPDEGEKVLAQKPKQPIFVGGHSLGGVMASRFANQHDIAGVIFLASYPDEKGAIQKLPVLSITGTEDHVLDKETYKKAQALLPKETEYVSIEGGNHAGFGSYGKQKGDGKAAISNQQQQKEVADTIIRWLDQQIQK